MGRMPDANMISRQDGVWNWPTITVLAESPLNANVLWAGTDDGCLQVSRDLGKTWQNVITRLPGAPKMTCVTRIVASRHAEGTAYVALDGHRNDDFEPYIFVTTDYGQSWRPITNGLRKDNGTVRAIREHHRNQNLLFAGTETGAYVSIDRGANWMPLKLNLPTAPVSDIAIHPRENDLILATHGRSIWLIDDITPLEQLTPQVLASDLHLFDIRPAISWRIYDNRRDHGGPGDKFFIGENPPYGALINYYLRAKPAETERVVISVEDSQGKRIREIEGTKEAGINRVAWDLCSSPPQAAGEAPGGRGFGRGSLVDPQTFTVKVTVGQKTVSKPVVVEEDTRISISPADRAARRAAINRAAEISAGATKDQQSITRLFTALNGALDGWKKPGATKIPDDVRKTAEDLARKAMEIQGQFVQPRATLWLGSSSPPLGGYPAVTMSQKIQSVGGAFEGLTAAPPKTDLAELESLATQVEQLGVAIDKLIQQDLAALNRMLTQAGVPVISVSPVERR